MMTSPTTVRRARLTTRALGILGAGFLLREAFSFWTGHPFDFESWVRTGYQVAQGQNPYAAFWPPVPGVSFAYLNQDLTPAAYLPFWPWVLGELYRLWEFVGGGNRFVLYFLLKQPGILADVADSYLLYQLGARWAEGRGPAMALLTFWSLFPYSIIVTAIWGQFDSLIVLILLILLYARSPIERSVLYGVGIFVKWLTVIFLPLEAFRDRGFRRSIAVVGLAVPAAVTVLVVVAEGWSFQGLGAFSVSQGHGTGQGENYAYVLSLPTVSATLSPISYLFTIAGYLWIPGVILGGWLAARWVGRGGAPAELRAMLFVITVLFLLRWGLYEQYFLYLFALLAIDVTMFHPARRKILGFTIGLATVDLLLNNDLGLRFLSPIDPGLSSYTIAIDANDSYGLFRLYALLVLAVIMTATLIQLLRTFLRDEEGPRPWLYLLADRLQQLWRRRPPASPSGP
jgi:hypothetical protein